MKRKIIFTIYIIFLIALFVFSYPICQAYIRNYNAGNSLYEDGEYEEAIEKYKKALNSFVPKKQDCKIRINYALAICETISVNEKDEISIQNAIEEYESAVEILEVKDCDFHNDDAKQLKSDILDEIDRLKNLLKKNNSKDEEEDPEEKEEEPKEEKKENSKTIEQKIQQVKEEATKAQRDTEAQFKNYEYDYDRVEKNW